MNGRITQTGTLLSLLILAGSVVACRQASALAGELDVPTTTVKQADVQLKTLTTGALRSKDSRVIAAPPIAGGTLQIVKLARFGAQVHKGDVVLEFDPSQQEYNLAQNRSDLLQAEQEIAKAMRRRTFLRWTRPSEPWRSSNRTSTPTALPTKRRWRSARKNVTKRVWPWTRQKKTLRK